MTPPVSTRGRRRNSWAVFQGSGDEREVTSQLLDDVKSREHKDGRVPE
jgi:hypothetical protein